MFLVCSDRRPAFRSCRRSDTGVCVCVVCGVTQGCVCVCSVL